MLHRGSPENPRDEVAPAGFAILDGALGLSSETPDARRRLRFAEWITETDHPLTARVIVNRYWAMLFGHGLVETPEDFGLQGAYPTHPELLDWLATEYPRIGWDTKRLLKLMVTSATYRQSSDATPELLAVDPDNRLLARAPRYRLQAEQN